MANPQVNQPGNPGIQQVDPVLVQLRDLLLGAQATSTSTSKLEKFNSSTMSWMEYE